MGTYRDELSADYPELKGAPIFTIGCPHSWGYCDKADTPCGKIGRANVTRHHCAECWGQKMDRPKPYRIEYKDENGGMVTNCVMMWFVHTYTRIPMCVVRVERDVRYDECPVGLFMTDADGVFLKTEIINDETGLNTAVHIGLGLSRKFEADTVVTPIKYPFKERDRK